MGSLSIWHILIFAVIALLLFGGRGKVSDLMGDVAKGINSFRKGLRDSDHDDDHRPAPPPPQPLPMDRDKDQVGR
ncbi:MAG TPA: twin-arginine translocase TatA/TatE family subunit [Rhizomicrobium sp.]